MKWVLYLSFLLVLAASGAQADEQKEIQHLYQRGLAGDKDAVNQCIAKLETALQRDASNQLARVYLGSAYTLRSRDLGFGPKKLQALRHGLALMDEAVANAPNEPKVRLARALTTSSLPALFGRRSESERDFATLREMAKTQPQKFEPGDLQTVLSH